MPRPRAPTRPTSGHPSSRQREQLAKRCKCPLSCPFFAICSRGSCTHARRMDLWWERRPTLFSSHSSSTTLKRHDAPRQPRTGSGSSAGCRWEEGSCSMDKGCGLKAREARIRELAGLNLRQKEGRRKDQQRKELPPSAALSCPALRRPGGDGLLLDSKGSGRGSRIASFLPPSFSPSLFTHTPMPSLHQS